MRQFQEIHSTCRRGLTYKSPIMLSTLRSASSGEIESMLIDGDGDADANDEDPTVVACTIRRAITSPSSTMIATTISLTHNFSTSKRENVKWKKKYQMMIHVIRSMALLFRWSCIASSFIARILQRQKKLAR